MGTPVVNLSLDRRCSVVYFFLSFGEQQVKNTLVTSSANNERNKTSEQLKSFIRLSLREKNLSDAGILITFGVVSGLLSVVDSDVLQTELNTLWEKVISE